MKNIFIAARTFIVLSVLTGLIYPILIYLIGSGLFSSQASGSLIYRNQRIVGSELIAQKFDSEGYFHSRPSAVDFATLPSGASNFGATSVAFKAEVDRRRQKYGMTAPTDLLMTSGSGLDPHLTLESVKFQMERVVTARKIAGLKKEKLLRLVDDLAEDSHLEFLGLKRINVLKLNLALDRLTNEP